MAGCVGDDKKEVSFVANNLNPIELYIVCEWLTNRHFCLVLDHRGQVDDFNFCDCEKDAIVCSRLVLLSLFCEACLGEFWSQAVAADPLDVLVVLLKVH